ncbi:MAG: diphthine synthase [archaeon]
MFFLIGIGLKKNNLTLEALEKINSCTKIFLESYTSAYSEGKISGLEKLFSKEIVSLERNSVEENALKFFSGAKKENIALLVFGNPLTATTHLSLLAELKKEKILFEVIPGISVSNFVSFTGLQEYKFGRTVSVVFQRENYSPESFFDAIEKNKSVGLHTLCLLDIESEKNRFMKINDALKILESIESKRNNRVISESVLIGISRAGSAEMKIKAGSSKELKEFDFGKQPHSLIVCGNLSEDEKDFLKIFSGWNGKNNVSAKNFSGEASLGIKLAEKTKKYFSLTQKALEKIELKKDLNAKDKAVALDFLSMAKNYFSDAKHFNEKKDFLNALASLSYAHAWLDAGIRAELFDGKDDDALFTLK